MWFSQRLRPQLQIQNLSNLSIILLYRPKTNKVIRVIEGDFFNQHDVDILDEKTISIYNNNVFLPYNNTRLVENNELIIYDFEKNKFSKKYEEIFKKLEINSATSGLADFLPDGSVVVEDQNNGRIFFINNLGEVVWEFNNLNSNKRLYDIWWARVIDINKSNQIF